MILWSVISCYHFEAADSSETGQLLVAISGSPSFKSGMTSDSCQRLGKTDDIRERFTISVRVGKMHGRASLITAMETLSRPGALLDGKDSTTLRTCPHDTG